MAQRSEGWRSFGDRAGSVTLIKTVVSDDGGALSVAAFHPYIDGLPASWAKPVPLAAGTHTLTKTAVNDNGGTLTRGDSDPYRDGNPVPWDASIPLSAGSHAVSETQVSGYAALAWGCDCTANGSLVAVLGGVCACTVTNDHIGSAVTSIAPNTGVSTAPSTSSILGGSDFRLRASVKLAKAGQSDI